MSKGLCRTYARFTLDDQEYVRVVETSSLRSNGTTAFLTTWRTSCPDCGAVFTFDHPERPGPIKPVRRCKPCRALAGGRRVVTASSHDRTHSKGNGSVWPVARPTGRETGVDVVALVARDAAAMSHRAVSELEQHGYVDPSLALRKLSEQQQQSPPRVEHKQRKSRNGGVFKDR